MKTFDGFIQTKDGFQFGHIEIEDGKVIGIVEGEMSSDPSASGVVCRSFVNAHTHCADMGLNIPPGLSLEELVAPPDGLKHRYLREIGNKELRKNMITFNSDSKKNGIGKFIDFRENGAEGCRLLRETVPDSVILGRPKSKEYDPEEIDIILDIADGLGISSISDMPVRYIDDLADHVRRRRKIFAIHASERIHEDIDTILSLDPAFLVHMVEATDSDLLKCSETETPIIVCPRSNAYFGKIPPIARMLACGVSVALGTDNAMLCDPDIISEARSAASILSDSAYGPKNLWDMICYGRNILFGQKDRYVTAGAHASDLAIIPCDISGGLPSPADCGSAFVPDI